MITELKRAGYYFRFGGIKLALIAIDGHLHHKDRTGEFVSERLQKASPEGYPELLRILYGMWTGKHLDIDNPRTFDEKLAWLKIYDSTPLKTQLADKYEVRSYVESKVGKDILIPLLGVWDSFDEIDFDALPDEFVLKTNNGSADNILVYDKKQLDMQAAREKMEKGLRSNFAFHSLELHYANIRPRIIAEQFLHSDDDLRDYKIFCFNGKPRFIQVIGYRQSKDHVTESAIYNTDWERQEFYDLDFVAPPKDYERPQRLERMLEYASVLSEPFAFVRVDLYSLDDGSIYFGEMTFLPTGGKNEFRPEGTDVMLGDMIDLSHVEKHTYAR